MDYCTSGNGVANEYCQKFAALEQAEIQEVALVKTTQKELEEMYINDTFIYLTTNNGADTNFHGIKGDQNKGVNAPYIVCSEHTKASWEAYEKNQNPEQPTLPILPGITIPIG